MATWKRVSAAPITTEREVRVFDADNPDRTGEVRVFRTREGIRLGGTVTNTTGRTDEDGNFWPIGVGVLDADPTFV